MQVSRWLGYEPEEEEEENAGKDDLPHKIKPRPRKQNQDRCCTKNYKRNDQPCSLF